MDTSELCEGSQEVAESLVLRYSLMFNVLCGVTAIPLVLWVIKATYNHKLVHYNIKWILIFHLSCLVAHDIFRIINHVWDISIFLMSSPGDCNVFDISRCIIIRAPINLTMYLAFSGTFMLSIERCIATRRLSTYGKNRTVGPVLVLIQIVTAVAFMCIVYMKLDYQKLMTYCLITSLSPPSLVLGSIFSLLILQVTAVITFEVLMRINKAKKRNLLHSRNAHFSGGVISKLYQVRENVRTMKTLMLFFLLSCVNSFCYNFLRGFVHWHKPRFSRPLFFALIEVSIHLPQFSLILPAVLWYSYRKVSREAEVKHREKLDRDAPENTKLHFDMIAESWK
nr:7TM GPCR domain containing protein [Haemonchus contortus]